MNCLFYVLALALFVLGCNDYNIQYDWVCDSSTAERRAQFIQDCAKAANPMSDEEGEDLVNQCESTATHLFCTREMTVQDFSRSSGAIWCRQASGKALKACQDFGFKP